MEKNNKSLTVDDFRNCLKKYGLKVTPQRLAVHEAMLKLVHASADMVTEEIKASGNAKVTVASVYNILTQLTLLGIYSHRMSANNKMYFDVNSSRHIHLYDTVNHRFTDVVDDEFRKYAEEKLLSHRFRGFKLDGVDIQILAHPSTRKTAGRKKADSGKQ